MDIKKIKTLREETGVSISLCKKALEESGGDMEKAKRVLQQWGADVAAKKNPNPAQEGAIFSYVHHNKKIASLVEIACQTDFVSQNKEFQHLGQEIAMQVASVEAKNTEELLTQQYIRDPSKKIIDLINEAALKFGEKIKITRFIRWQIGL